MSNKISMDKKYTYNGRPVEIITVTRGGNLYPVVIKTADFGFAVFTAEGCNLEGGKVQLIEVKPTLWINIYPRGMGITRHLTKVDADSYPANDNTSRIACIEFKEGDGV
jgi:hypothetical protein